MTSLHTINKAPSSQLLETCSQTLSDGDAIIFIEDGVYHVQSSSLLDGVSKEINLFVLREDLSARGLQDDSSGRTDSVGYRGFVKLCTEYDKVISWF